MAGVDHLVANCCKIQQFVYTPPLGRSAPPGVVYIESVVFYSSLHIHHQMVHTRHFLIFSKPQPGDGVYLWGPHFIGFNINMVYVVRCFKVIGKVSQDFPVLPRFIPNRLGYFWIWRWNLLGYHWMVLETLGIYWKSFCVRSNPV